MKNTKFLLPNGYKKPGWWIFCITVVLIVLHFIFQSQCDFSLNNIRELDGAIQKVVAWMLLYEKTSIEVNKVAEVLNDFFPEQHTMQVDISTIQSVVERQFDVTHEELVGSKRTRNINEARQVAMFLSRQLTDKSFPDIGTYFGNRDHTTIMHGVKKIEELMSHDEAVYKQIENLRSLINEHTQNQ